MTGRKRKVIEELPVDTKQIKRTRVLKVYERQLSEQEGSFHAVATYLSITAEQWAGFVDFCDARLSYSRYQHAEFHRCFKMALQDLGFEFVGQKGSRLKTTYDVRRRVTANIWTEFYCFKESGEYTGYRMLKTEFASIMQYLFCIHDDWMNSANPESTVPSTILRGILIYFPEVAKKYFPHLDNFMTQISPYIHSAIDLFKIKRDYYTVPVEPEKSDETDSISSTSSYSSVSSGSSVISSYSDNGSSFMTVKASEHEKMYSTQAFLESPSAAVKHHRSKTIHVHPYDVALFIYAEAKRQSLAGAGTVSECYRNLVVSLRTLPAEFKEKLVDHIVALKEHVFGKDQKFCVGDVIDREKIAPTRKKKQILLMHYECTESNGEYILTFNRKKYPVLDVRLAIEYLGLKYRKLFNVMAKESMRWDDNKVYLHLDTKNYKALTECIVFYELFKDRPHYSVPLYPVITQKYLKGTASDVEHCTKVILKLLRETRLRYSFASSINPRSYKWISGKNKDEIIYARMLPKIIKRYKTMDNLWHRLTCPFNNVDLLFFGPTDRWMKKTSETVDGLMKFDNMDKNGGKYKVNWSVTGFNYNTFNIYVAMVAFFGATERHSIRFGALRNIKRLIHGEDWFQKDYPMLTRALDKLFNGTYIPGIWNYADEAIVDLPLTEDGITDVRKLQDFSNDELNIWDYVHVQLFKLCTDPRLSDNLAVYLFEAMTLWQRKHCPIGRTSLPVTDHVDILPEMDTVKDMVSDFLKEAKLFVPEYKVDVVYQGDLLTENYFFTFFLESLERLSFYPTKYTQEQTEAERASFRGDQVLPPDPEERWLPVDNDIVETMETITKFPVYYDKDNQFKPVMNDAVLPTIWSLNGIFTGSKEFFRQSIKRHPDFKSFITADPEFLNCMICYPVYSLL